MKYEIRQIERLAEYAIWRLLPTGERLEFLPGQFVKLTNKEGVARPYSIASPPSWPYLEFLFHVVPGGQFSSYVEKAEVGDEVEVSKAAGHFTYSGEDKVIFIGGGSGIAPIMGILRHIIAERKQGDFKLFFSNRYFHGTPYLSELLSYEDAGIIDLHLTFTKEEVEGYRSGRFSPQDILELGDLSEYTVFLCGNMAMAKTFMEELKDKVKAFKVEAWG